MSTNLLYLNDSFGKIWCQKWKLKWSLNCLQHFCWMNSIRMVCKRSIKNASKRQRKREMSVAILCTHKRRKRRSVFDRRIFVFLFYSNSFCFLFLSKSLLCCSFYISYGAENISYMRYKQSHCQNDNLSKNWNNCKVWTTHVYSVLSLSYYYELLCIE